MLRILLRAPEYQPSACLQRFSWLHLFHSLFFIVIIVFAWLQGFSWVPNISVMVSLNPPRAFTTSIPRIVFPSLKHTYRWEMWRNFTSLLLGCISSLMFTWLHSQTIFYRWADSQSTNMLIQWQTVIIIHHIVLQLGVGDISMKNYRKPINRYFWNYRQLIDIGKWKFINYRKIIDIGKCIKF